MKAESPVNRKEKLGKLSVAATTVMTGREASNPTPARPPAQAAGRDLLAFLLLRHTALRGFDATDIRWSEIDLRERMLCRVTHKRQKRVWIPLHPELQFVALEPECTQRTSAQSGRLNRASSIPKPAGQMTRPRLYFPANQGDGRARRAL